MIVIALLPAQYAGTLDVFDTTRIDARTTEPAPIVRTNGGTTGRDVLAGDVMTTPAARLHVTDHFWDYSLGYSPTLTEEDVELGLQEPQVLHTGSASIGWHGRFVRIVLSEGATYGTLNSAFLYALPNGQSAQGTGATSTGGATTTGPGTTGGATAVLSAPQPVDISYGASSTALSVAVVTGRRTNFFVSGSYFFSGGLTTASRTVLPEQYGGTATAGFGYAASRADAFTTVLNAADTITSGQCVAPSGQAGVQTVPFCVVRTPLASAQEALRHSFSGAANLTVTVGASAAVADTPYIHDAVVDPILQAAYSESLSARNTSSFSVSAGFVPTVDLRTGLPSSRAQASVSLAEPVAPRTTLTFTGTFLQSVAIPVADPYPITAVTAALDARIRLDRQVDLGLGLQTLWQNQPPYGTLVSNIGYVSVTGRLPTARF